MANTYLETFIPSRRPILVPVLIVVPIILIGLGVALFICCRKKQRIRPRPRKKKAAKKIVVSTGPPTKAATKDDGQPVADGDQPVADGDQPVTDGDLIVATPVWTKLIDPGTGTPYYQNSITGATQWDPPPDFADD